MVPIRLHPGMLVKPRRNFGNFETDTPGRSAALLWSSFSALGLFWDKTGAQYRRINHQKPGSKHGGMRAGIRNKVIWLAALFMWDYRSC